MFSPATRYFTYGVLLALLAVVLWLAATSLRRESEDTARSETTTINIGTPLVGDRPEGEPPAAAAQQEESAGENEGAAENGSGDGDAQAPDGDAAPGAPASPAGEEFYRSAQCGGCHGDDLAGAKQGPPLKGLSRYYNAGELKTFLKDPAAYAIDNPRLSSLGQQYKMLMPRARLSDDDLATLAQWLLAQ